MLNVVLAVIMDAFNEVEENKIDPYEENEK